MRSSSATFPLVSIVSPCWNGEHYVTRFLESVWTQTYPNIELIVVDDGSTDRTAEVIRAFFPKLEARNIHCQLLQKENGGIASALNTGFTAVSGTFLCTPDSDDVLTPEHIAKMSAPLIEDDSVDMTLCGNKSIIESTGEVKSVLHNVCDPGEDLLMQLLEMKLRALPGLYMIRISSFRKKNPDFRIPEFRAAQNLQMVLPMLVDSKVVFVDELLYHYYLRDSSLSHANKGYEKKTSTYKAYAEITEYLLTHISLKDPEPYLKCARETANIPLFKYALRYRKRTDAKIYYQHLRDCKRISWRHKLKYLFLLACFWKQ